MKLMDKVGPPEKPFDNPTVEHFKGKLPNIDSNLFKIPSLK